MKKTQLFCGFIFFNLMIQFLQAQNPRIDSLKNELTNNKEANRFDILWGLAYELFDVDNFQALDYASQAHEFALIHRDTLSIVKSGRIYGQLLRRVDRVEDAIDVLNSVLFMAKRHKLKKELKIILNALATAHVERSEYTKALDYNFQSLVMREFEGDKREISVSLNNIGIVYFRIENYSLALEYFLKSVKLKEEISDSTSLDLIFINIGLCYGELKEYNESKKYFDQANIICYPNCSYNVVMAREFGLGYFWLAKKSYHESQMHFEKSLEISIREGSRRHQLENLIGLITLFLETNNFAKSKIYLDSIDQISQKDQYPELLASIYRSNAVYYDKVKNSTVSNLYFIKYSELRDKRLSEEINRDLFKVQAKMSERENLGQIESQGRILKLQEESLSQQKILIVMISVIGLLVTGLLIILFRRNRIKQRINILLDQKVKERTIELEKNRNDLKHAHDEQAHILSLVSNDLNSSLATIKGLSEAAKMDLPEEKIIYFKEAESMTQRLIGYVNRYHFNNKIK
ncbi:MAG: tetratricopeptide repeat protein [Cyclobacteriaceae bacterium]|nr:tetratricopeptide repeat protein [Cyclobacteriaceae bacterium]